MELLKLLISKTATMTKEGLWRKMLFVDVKKAHIVPLCDQDVYFWLPAEAGPAQGECGKLEHWLYGCRPAAQAWENHYAARLESVGFIRGAGNPVAFLHPARDLACVVHGDDFTFSGLDGDLTWIENLMKQWSDVKIRARLGREETDDKKIDVLGRRLVWTKAGIEYQADPRHRAEVLEQFGLGPESKGLKVTGGHEEEKEDDYELEPKEAKQFRGVAARGNYLAQDCPDIQYAAKEICRGMAKPSFRS